MRRHRLALFALLVFLAAIGLALVFTVGARSKNVRGSDATLSLTAQSLAPTATPIGVGHMTDRQGDMSIPITVKNSDGTVATTTTLGNWIHNRDRIMKKLGWR